ncbi:pyridoxal-phosphate dependent enzyme [Allochromatium palmeri]|uniref:cysteine synthase n=1 Tax=Allochromatium palmeri TaxID=231048 RepID=A0A6N8EG25_9GAMM|nr:pyridoxal-phosphate dependent enzyme [Allochromatium palmeri]MTW23195.1 pyridoxal-phosphate dependent enzyme [Allochromatium palmeri]
MSHTPTYSEQAGRYASASLSGDQLSRDLVLRLISSIGPVQNVLDVGCGAGTLLKRLSESNPEAVLAGVDICDEFLQMAREAVPRGVFRNAKASTIPFPDGTFDLVVSTWALQHCAQVEQAMQEIARTTRPGGHVVLCLFHPIQSLMHLHEEVVSGTREFTDYWGHDTFINRLSYGVDVEEMHHSMDAYIGEGFLRHFDLLHFSEAKQLTSPNVANVNHPSFFLVKARRRSKPNADAALQLRDGETMRGAPPGALSPSAPRNPNPLPAIADSVTQLIGNTPLVRADLGLPCETLLKLEYLNPMGSIKDRLIRAIDAAMVEGVLKPGDTVVEATAGNTGIAFMAALASRGLKGKILLMEKFSELKANTMRLLGAEVIRVPDDQNDQLAAKRLAKEEGAFHFGQFYNPLNPEIHRRGTAEEIWRQCGGRVDAVVAGCGTGGTLMGLCRGLRERNPALKIIGVSPEGARLVADEPVGCWGIEGIGTPYAPPLCEVERVDEWIRVSDAAAFTTAHGLMCGHGMFCGSSSGAIVAGALQSRILQSLTLQQRCVVILPDSAKNYPDTLMNYDWMRQHGFLSR